MSKDSDQRRRPARVECAPLPWELDLAIVAIFSCLDRFGLKPPFKELLDFAGSERLKVRTPKDVVPGSGTRFEAVPKERPCF